MYIAEVRRTVLPPVSEADRCASAVAILQRGCLSNKSKAVMPDFCSAAGCSCQRNAKTKENGITFHRYVFCFFPIVPRDWTPQQVEQVYGEFLHLIFRYHLTVRTAPVFKLQRINKQILALQLNCRSDSITANRLTS